MAARQYYVYIMASYSRTIYIGVTNDLRRRVYQHRTKQIEGFTAKYNVNRLVFFESTASVQSALAREKELKGWRREKKVKLIEAENPNWRDLSTGWYDLRVGGR